MHELIDILIADRVKSLKFWIRQGAVETQNICVAEMAAQALLQEIK
jgi:hypothetical protein